MLCKRIIPCLDIKDGRVVKGVNFIGLRDAGDPVEVAKRYNDQGADELCFLDITASVEARGLLYDLIERVASQVKRRVAVVFDRRGVKHGADVAQNALRLARHFLLDFFGVQHPNVMYQPRVVAKVVHDQSLVG